MFCLREYIKKGFIDAVGKMSNYQIILNSTGWMEKGVFTEEDLSEVNTAIEEWEKKQNAMSNTNEDNNTVNNTIIEPTEEVDDTTKDFDTIEKNNANTIENADIQTDETEDNADILSEYVEV